MGIKKDDKIKDCNDPMRKTITVTITNNLRYKEFLECPNLDKFNPRSNVLFEDGTPMGYWFGMNLRKISESKNPFCIEIIKQYNERNKKNQLKNSFYLRKYKYIFLIMDGMDKFSFNSNLRFPDGTFVNEWFLQNKDDILSSDNDIDIIIKKQYFDHLGFENLKAEFLRGDVSKFCPDECVRFSTGAIMNFWWDCFKDKILSSTDIKSLKIKEQYESYLSIANNDNKSKEVLTKKL